MAVAISIHDLAIDLELYHFCGVSKLALKLLEPTKYGEVDNCLERQRLVGYGKWGIPQSGTTFMPPFRHDPRNITKCPKQDQAK
jgi:hypothetical protein